MSKKKRVKAVVSQFEQSAMLNNQAYETWYLRLKEMAINRFEWINLPDTVDERFLELTLFEKGFALFFQDPVVGIYLALQTTIGGEWNVYNIPIFREAVASNSYRCERNNQNSVIIYNNYLHETDEEICQFYAYRLYNLERTIDVNVKAQKTPILIRSSEAQRLSMKNLYMQYDGNTPFMFGDKNLDTTGIEAINTNAPYVSDKLQVLKHQYLNEYYTYLGIENSNEDKKERLVESEVASNYGIVEMNRNTGLNARKQACKQINNMFGLNIDVAFRSNVDTKLNQAFKPELKEEVTTEAGEPESREEEDA